MTAEEYISQIPLWTRKKNSLEEIRHFLNALGNPDRKIPIIHVAGTNGKGSVCAYLSSALKEAGYSTGTFVSPHLENIRERFLLNGVLVDMQLFEEIFFQVKTAVDRLTQKGYRHPSFFEFLFYMAALLFARQKVDFCIMETGLGGRLDATNVVEHPLVSVITSISLEHTQYLGSTLEEIAGEKAGIIKYRVPVVYDGNCPEAAAVMKKKAAQMESPAYSITREDFSVHQAAPKEKGLVLRGRGKGKNLGELSIPFSASYQADNGALAWQTLLVLMENGRLDSCRENLLRLGMKKTLWPGRMEEVRPGVYLDGAHNPGGIRAFVESAKTIPAARRMVLFGAVSDKAYEEMIAYLCCNLKPDLVVTTHIKSSRDVKDEGISDCFRKSGCPVKSFLRADKALAFLLNQKEEGDVVFCLGSLYLIGELKEYLV